MPNWCEGYLKIRGKREDLINFIENEILIVELTDKKMNAKNVKMHTNKVWYSFSIKDNKNTVLYFKDSNRCFIDQYKISFFEFLNDEKYPIRYLTLNIRKAWDIDEKVFKSYSKKYHLDFNIFASESGMKFERYITITDGKIVKNKTKYFHDFYFEAINPELGG